MMEWIKCEDRLPEATKKMVLIYSKMGMEIGTGYEIAFWDGGTHWQPLPLPPKVEQEEPC